jgi:hypothetical protein
MPIYPKGPAAAILTRCSVGGEDTICHKENRHEPCDAQILRGGDGKLTERRSIQPQGDGAGIAGTGIRQVTLWWSMA